jgi:hypothetical protein
MDPMANGSIYRRNDRKKPWIVHAWALSLVGTRARDLRKQMPPRSRSSTWGG